MRSPLRFFLFGHVETTRPVRAARYPGEVRNET